MVTVWVEKKNIGYVILPFDVFQFGPIEVNLLEPFYAILLTSSMIMNRGGGTVKFQVRQL